MSIREPLHSIFFTFLSAVFKKKSKTGSICYCPSCKDNLSSQKEKNYIVDSEDDNLISYMCVMCGEVSHWFFGAPVPILLGSRDGKAKGNGPSIG